MSNVAHAPLPAPSGTAAITIDMSVDLSSRRRPGPRKQYFMTPHEALRLVNAAFYATARGTPLYAHVVIVWNRTPEWDPGRWAMAETKLWHAAAEWLARRGVEPVRVYVRENVHGRGPHSHWAVHLPADRWEALRSTFEEFLRKAGGFSRDDAVKVSGQPRRRPGGDPFSQIRGLLKYLCKGLDPNARIDVGFGAVPLVQVLGIDP